MIYEGSSMTIKQYFRLGDDNMRFYCPECKRVIDRRFVKPKTFEEGYRCVWCGTTVYSVKKILARVCDDYLQYLEKNGEDLTNYEA